MRGVSYAVRRFSTPLRTCMTEEETEYHTQWMWHQQSKGNNTWNYAYVDVRILPKTDANTVCNNRLLCNALLCICKVYELKLKNLQLLFFN